MVWLHRPMGFGGGTPAPTVSARHGGDRLRLMEGERDLLFRKALLHHRAPSGVIQTSSRKSHLKRSRKRGVDHRRVSDSPGAVCWGQLPEPPRLSPEAPARGRRRVSSGKVRGVGHDGASVAELGFQAGAGNGELVLGGLLLVGDGDAVLAGQRGGDASVL